MEPEEENALENGMPTEDTNTSAELEHLASIKKTKKSRTQDEQKRRIRQYMDGSILFKDELQKHWPFLFLFFFLCILLIANNYISESMVRDISKLKNDVKELRYKQLSTASELMGISRQSSIAKLLDSSGIKESVVPPIKLRKNENGGD